MAKCICRSLISSLFVFRGCNDNFMDSLAVLLREQTVPPENNLYLMNEVAKELFIIAKGAVELVTEGAEGETVAEVRQAGNVVGELGFFFGLRYGRVGGD